MNIITNKLAYLLTGNNSEDQVKRLSPYLNVFVINLAVAATVKIIKLIYFT